MSNNIKNKILINDNENSDDQITEEDLKINENISIIIEEEYYSETLVIIQNNILEYIIDKNVTICEYLSIKNIDNFITSNLQS
jgi:hypothetical protein